MRSEATTVEQYLAELEPDRREALEAVRQAILDNLPTGYQEAISSGMIAYQVPLETYPDTYNGRPLVYAALASQKRHMASARSTSRPLHRLQPAKRTNTAGRPALAPSPCRE